MKKKLLVLILILCILLSSIPVSANSTNTVEKGEAIVFVDYGKGFEKLDTLYFSKKVSSQTIALGKEVKAVKVVKGTCYELNLDELTINGVAPKGYERKLSKTDNDLIEVEK